MRARRWIAIALATAFVVFVGVLVAVRFAGPTPAQVEAMRVLAQPTPPVAGRDATDALWVLDHDVPPARHAEVGAAYRRYLDRFDALVRSGRRAEAERLVDPLAAWPAFAKADGDDDVLCDTQQPGCLAFVRRDLGAVHRTLVRHAGQLRAARRLREYDGARYGVVATPTQRLPLMAPGRPLVWTALAARFARGDHEGALRETCADLAAWRRLGADNDQLIFALVGTGLVRQDLVLLAEMLAELPADTPLPAACVAAVAPGAASESSLCAAIKTEYRFVASVAEDGFVSEEESGSDGVARWALDADHFVALVAPRYAAA
jgi:hypothetical protein